MLSLQWSTDKLKTEVIDVLRPRVEIQKRVRNGNARLFNIQLSSSSRARLPAANSSTRTYH
jgi:hypothetical protein